MTESHATAVQNHYSNNDLFQRILDALLCAGKNTDQLTPDDLSAVDHFHTRGRQATEELAVLAGRGPLTKGTNVLDVGCGIGGTARFLSSQFDCHVTGIDLSDNYIRTSERLSELVGLSDRNSFVQGSATQLPFETASFDLVWTEHAQMNIADKPQLYLEIARVLKPQGRIVFHDVFAVVGDGELTFPVPWADRSSISYLISQNEMKKRLAESGLRLIEWQEKGPDSRVAFAEVLERMKETSTLNEKQLGLHLLMGKDTRQKIGNYLDGLQRNVITVAMGVAEKTT